MEESLPEKERGPTASSSSSSSPEPPTSPPSSLSPSSTTSSSPQPQPSSPSDQRSTCPSCRRSFVPSRLIKHEAICALSKPRPAFNSRQQRLAHLPSLARPSSSSLQEQLLHNPWSWNSDGIRTRESSRPISGSSSYLGSQGHYHSPGNSLPPSPRSEHDSCGENVETRSSSSSSSSSSSVWSSSSELNDRVESQSIVNHNHEPAVSFNLRGFSAPTTTTTTATATASPVPLIPPSVSPSVLMMESSIPSSLEHTPRRWSSMAIRNQDSKSNSKRLSRLSNLSLLSSGAGSSSNLRRWIGVTATARSSRFSSVGVPNVASAIAATPPTSTFLSMGSFRSSWTPRSSFEGEDPAWKVVHWITLQAIRQDKRTWAGVRPVTPEFCFAPPAYRLDETGNRIPRPWNWKECQGCRKVFKVAEYPDHAAGCEHFFPFDRLPDELMTSILRFVPAPSKEVARGVNRRWRAVASDRLLWKEEALSRWKRAAPADFNDDWYTLYVERRKLERHWSDSSCRLTLLRGHTSGVTAVDFDETHVVSGARDCTVRIWVPDLLGPSKVADVLEGHSGPISAVKLLSPDRIVSASRDGTIRVWSHHGSEAAAVARQSSSHRRGSALLPEQVGIGGPTREQVVISSPGVGGGILDMSCIDSRAVAVGTLPGQVAGESRYKLGVVDLAVGGDFSVSWDDDVAGVSGMEYAKLPWGNDAPWEICTASPSTGVVATFDSRLGSNSPPVIVMDVGAGCSAFAAHRNLALVAHLGALSQWDRRMGRSIGSQVIPTLPGGPYFNSVQCTSLDFDQDRVISGVSSGGVRVWNLDPLESQIALDPLGGHSDAVRALAFNESRLVTASADLSVLVWDFGLADTLDPPGSLMGDNGRRGCWSGLKSKLWCK